MSKEEINLTEEQKAYVAEMKSKYSKDELYDMFVMDDQHYEKHKKQLKNNFIFGVIDILVVSSIFVLYHKKLFGGLSWDSEGLIANTPYGLIYFVITWIMIFFLCYGVLLMFVYLKYKYH